MSMATKEKKNRKRKPLRRAEKWGCDVLPMAGRLLVTLIVIIVLGLMFSALQGVESFFIRAVITLVVVSGLLVLNFNDGLNKGAQDASASRAWDTAKNAGHKLTEKDDVSCYHPLKAVCAALVVFGVFLVLAVYIGMTSKQYTYTLQDLPTWMLQTYGARGDVMEPLGAYSVEMGMELRDWCRVIVRLPLMIFINLFEDPLKMSQLIDRLSAPIIALYPAAYVIGYFCGPFAQRKLARANKRAKKVAVRRAQKSNLVEELLGQQNQVHYGHQREDEKKKRRDLV